MMKITNALKAWLIDRGRAKATATDDEFRASVSQAFMDGSLSGDKYKSLALCDDEEEPEMTKAQQIFGGAKGNGTGGSRIRVRGASEQYDDVRHEASHVRTGRKVFFDDGSEVRRSSQKELAMAGAFLKYSARRAGISVEWGEHDQALFSQVVDDHAWASYSGEPGEEKIFQPGAVKAPLLDDSTSGGLEAAPIFFDDQVVMTPLLIGELAPTVQIVPISRGRRIEAASFSQPSVQWNEGDAASGTIFDSTGQIAALDSTVFDLSCHILVGRNFLSDSPLQIGTLLVSAIGERMSEAIETALATGNGTSQIQGIMGASGTTSVSFGSVAATVSAYLSLLFGVPKNLRAGSSNSSNFVLAGNEVSYRRARAIATGVTGDTRLVFGMEVEDYSVFGRPYKIVPAMANNQLFAGAMARYRLYRRLGTSVEWTTQGQTLQTKNEALLTVRQRWAGRPMIPSAFAVVSNAEG